MLADVTLAGAIGRERVLPLLAAHLTRKDIRAIADGQGDPVPYVHRAVIVACDGAIRRAADLSRRPPGCVPSRQSCAPKGQRRRWPCSGAMMRCRRRECCRR